MDDGKAISGITKKINIVDEETANIPTISRHTPLVTFMTTDDNNPTQSVITTAEPQIDDKKGVNITNKAGIDIVPISIKPQQMLSKSNEPMATVAQADISDVDSKTKDQTEAIDDINDETGLKHSTQSEVFEASDSLPDENEKRTSEILDNMQSPKIYDTKEYFVPIKNTEHSHGGIQIVVAGILSAITIGVIVACVVMFVL